MSKVLAHPIDSVMHCLDSDLNPCHLAVQVRGRFNIEEMRHRLERDDILLRLGGARFCEGGFCALPRWDLSQEKPIGLGEIEIIPFEWQRFNPDTELKAPTELIYLTILHEERDDWLILSWSHTLTDARGAEEILRLVCGESPRSSIRKLPLKLTPVKLSTEFGMYCRETRKDKSRTSPKPCSRFFVTLDKQDLWKDSESSFFRSARLLSALVTVIDSDTPLLCSMPVLQGRKRAFPGNQLALLHLTVTAQATVDATYQRIVKEMEEVLRRQLPDLSLRLLSIASRFSPWALQKLVSYPGRGRFADLCVSSLGTSLVPNTVAGRPVKTVVHYPPLLPWGGSTLVYYDFAETAALCSIGADETLLPRLLSVLKGDDVKRIGEALVV